MVASDIASIAGTVMSRGAHAPEGAIADKVVLLADKRLLVAEDYARDNGVQSYYALCRTKGAAERIERVPLETIQQILNLADTMASKGGSDGDGLSSRQSEVISIIKDAVKRRASDIHFINGENVTIIKYRVDGVLREMRRMTAVDGLALCRTMYDSMSDGSVRAGYKIHKSQDGRISREFLRGINLTGSRIATRPMETNNLFVLRLLYPGKGVADLASLGYFRDQVALIRRMMRRDGVNLFSGVTGSGKSTSLQVICSLIIEMCGGNTHLLTIEDPPEYFIEGAVQTPLQYDPTDPSSIGPAWAQAITNAMRLDPDYMMVGELRDFASSMAAIQAAMTGHGLWTTTHAKNPFASLDRLADLNVPMGRLSDASLFTGLINQGLVPVLCTHDGCARNYIDHRSEFDEEMRERIEKYCKVDKVRVSCAPTSTDCPVCGGLGYVGRTVAAEVVQPNQRLLDIYRAEGSAAARSHWVKNEDGMTALQHAIAKVNMGIVDPVSVEDALHRGLDEDELTLA
ncbi:GspE/PulE family protein [Ralstonia sp. ASV6]|uniref:GspE/PulE family protein n=1 Tax=Ralstonia sp. ASV6 TaxID=2795124 RepID=UPI0018EAF3A2|nr:ATPase, T2SS/T4P/T4SS family [Ralstonia sp. ASV6]